MTRIQLNAIKECYEMLEKGLNDPRRINSAYKHINTIEGFEPPMRAKILAITRYMMLSWQDEMKSLETTEKKALLDSQDDAFTIKDSIGKIENLNQQTHKENLENDHDLMEFLTKEEKEDLKSPHSGTVLETVSSKGKTVRTQSKNLNHVKK